MKHEDRVAGLIKGHENLLIGLVHNREVKLPEHVKMDKLESAYDRLGQYVMVLVKRPASGK